MQLNNRLYVLSLLVTDERQWRKVVFFQHGVPWWSPSNNNRLLHVRYDKYSCLHPRKNHKHSIPHHCHPDTTGQRPCWPSFLFNFQNMTNLFIGVLTEGWTCLPWSQWSWSAGIGQSWSRDRWCENRHLKRMRWFYFSPFRRLWIFGTLHSPEVP